MTFSRDDPRAKLTIRLNEDLKEELEEYAENQGKSMSEIARNQLSDIVESTPEIEAKNGVIPPHQKDLRIAWEMLVMLTGGKSVIGMENALTMLSQEFGKPKTVVLESIVKPLEKRGYIQVQSRIDSVVIRVVVRP